MLKHKMLWVALALVLIIVLTTVLSMSWWWLSQSEPDQAQTKTTNEEVVHNETDRLQLLFEGNVAKETEALPSSEMSPLDEEFAEFKYKNLKRLMSTRIDTLDDYQLEMVVQQIISELPEMVSAGQIHPFDATFAHTQAMLKQGHKLQGFEVEAIKQNYGDLYPFPINSSLLELH